MLMSERIQQYLERLPAECQAEVLDFVEYLAAKVEVEAARQERGSWSSLSLSSAMRGMEDEDAPVYGPSDMKTVF